MFYDQTAYAIRCEWGAEGSSRLSSGCDVAIVVDVLSFTTCLDLAAERGAIVYPCRDGGEPARKLAEQKGALLAGRRSLGEGGYSLSPVSLQTLGRGEKLVLPSPNGATVSLTVGCQVTLAACLRNARAVAEAASCLGERILVVPAGERWKDGGLRPCLEDWIGAGAVLSHLRGLKSPEARAAEAAFQALKDELREVLTNCSSGRELIENGFAGDVELAAQADVSSSVPTLKDGGYCNGAYDCPDRQRP